MFYNAKAFNQYIGNWNTAAVTTMNSMFSGATDFNNNGQPLTTSGGSWNTAAVTTMTYMFYNAKAFNNGGVSLATNGDSWNTALVTNMYAMFYNAPAFNQNIGNWNTAKVTNMNYMFGLTAFNQDIRRWNTRAVTNMSNMFLNASKMIGKYSGAKGFDATPTNAFFNGRGRFPQKKKKSDIIKQLNETISTDQGELTITEVQQAIKNGKEPTMNGGLITIKAAIQYTSDNNEQQVLYTTSQNNQLNYIYNEFVKAKNENDLTSLLEHYKNIYNGSNYYTNLVNAIANSLL